jgi:hypothetical protein
LRILTPLIPALLAAWTPVLLRADAGAVAPFYVEAEDGATRGTGFVEAELTAPALSRVEDPRSGRMTLRMLAAGLRVELVHPERDGDHEVRALLADGRTAWVPVDRLRRRDSSSTLSRRNLLDRAGEQVLEPLKDLPAGLEYRRIVRDGARLHLVGIDLDVNPMLEFQPFTTAGNERETSPRRRRLGTVAQLAARADALVALNGPFFIPRGRDRGEPLGMLVAGGRVLHTVEDSWVRGLNRTYLAWTNAGRFVMGETDLEAREVLERNRQGTFARGQLAEGEHLEAVVGGLGRLVRAGDPEAWRSQAGDQFGAYYYSRRVRRPQSLIGLARGGRRLLLLVQEGRPHSRRCYTLPELGHLLTGYGATEVAFNDGGGSADLVLLEREIVRTEFAGARRQNSTILVIRERRASKPVMEPPPRPDRRI